MPAIEERGDQKTEDPSWWPEQVPGFASRQRGHASTTCLLPCSFRAPRVRGSPNGIQSSASSPFRHAHFAVIPLMICVQSCLCLDFPLRFPKLPCQLSHFRAKQHSADAAIELSQSSMPD